MNETPRRPLRSSRLAGAHARRRHCTRATTAAVAIASVLCLAPLAASAATTCGDKALSDQGKFCSASAEAMFCACGAETRNDYYVARTICTNEPESKDRAECFADAEGSREEAADVCSEQHDGRLETCGLFGQGRYDPEFEANLFDSNFARPTKPNPYYPLRIGNVWEFASEAESVRLEVLDRTKLIDGVPCLVVRDLVSEDGHLKEATDDWFAQAKDGNVWYCGEESKDYETFRGDKPKAIELISIEGSFKAGRDGADPGIIFLYSPVKGDAYREEFSPGNAEDIAIVLSSKYKYGTNAELDESVPASLARYFCSGGDCVVTKNISPQDPGVVERKYYAKGIGTFLEVGPDGEVLRLVGCNFNSRCGAIPQP